MHDTAPVVTLRRFTPRYLTALTAFLNQSFAEHRHYTPIAEAEFAERVLVRPEFDPPRPDPGNGR
jgi:hypothetical protein